MPTIRELIDIEVREVKGLGETERTEFADALENVLISDLQRRLESSTEAQINNLKQKHADELRELRDKLETQDSIREKYQDNEDRLEERNKKQNEHIGKLSSEISVLIRQVKKLQERGPVSIQEHDSLLEERDFLRELALSNATGERI